jgi:DNA-binding PadR family transcriptional regulator
MKKTTQKKVTNADENEGPDKKLGTLQLRILMLVWDRQMYGLEIQKHLALRGLNVSTSQLYPALNKLLQSQTLESKSVHKIGADRIFYWTSEYGKSVILKYIADFMETLVEFQFEKFGTWASEIKKYVEIKAGMVIVDFSLREMESLLIQFAPLVSNAGHYFVVSQNPGSGELIKERIKHYALEDYVRILASENNKVNIGDQSADIAFVFITLHEENTEWIVPEIHRILKHHGKALIVDMEHIENHMLIDMLTRFTIGHSRTGLIVDKFTKYVLDLGFQIEKLERNGGLVFILLNKQK